MNHCISRVRLMLVFLLLAVGLSSCLVSSRSDVTVFNKDEYANSVSIQTIRVPMLITKPVVRTYLKSEKKVPKEVSDVIGGLKKIRVTVAQTVNPQLINEFHSAINQFPGEVWLSVHQADQWIYLKGDQNSKNVIKTITLVISAPEQHRLVYVTMKCELTPTQLGELINFAINADEEKLIKKLIVPSSLTRVMQE